MVPHLHRVVRLWILGRPTSIPMASGATAPPFLAKGSPPSTEPSDNEEYASLSAGTLRSLPGLTENADTGSSDEVSSLPPQFATTDLSALRVSCEANRAMVKDLAEEVASLRRGDLQRSLQLDDASAELRQEMVALRRELLDSMAKLVEVVYHDQLHVDGSEAGCEDHDEHSPLDLISLDLSILSSSRLSPSASTSTSAHTTPRSRRTRSSPSSRRRFLPEYDAHIAEKREVAVQTAMLPDDFLPEPSVESLACLPKQPAKPTHVDLSPALPSSPPTPDSIMDVTGRVLMGVGDGMISTASLISSGFTAMGTEVSKLFRFH